MKLAIQEDMLPGDTALERLEHAKSVGVDGVEFWAAGLTECVPEIAAALEDIGLEAAAVNVNGTQLLHPDYAERDHAIMTIRQAMADALDLGAQGVIFTSHHPTTPRLPDLHPYKSADELEGELLVTQLRTTLCDLAYAMGAELYLTPMNRYETHLIRRLEHAAVVLQKNNDHPHLKIAANLFHMAMEEVDLLAALRAHLSQIGYIHVADHNRRLPGQGNMDFEAVFTVLKEYPYEGWLTLSCGTPGQNAMNAHAFLSELPQSIALLRGWM